MSERIKYDFDRLLKNITNEERMNLAYNILLGVDKGVIGKTECPGIRFTEESICGDKSLINAYKKMYPATEGFWFRVVSYDDGGSWIEQEKIALKDAIKLAYDISDIHTSVEVQACFEDFEEECILYIGTPADNYQNNAYTSIGCMRIAEFQNVKTLQNKGWYLKNI